MTKYLRKMIRRWFRRNNPLRKLEYIDLTKKLVR
jgi:hypothetical protein